MAAQPSEPVQKPKGKPRGKPFAKDDPRRNPGGLSKDRRELREMLEGERDVVHTSLMTLVREGNPVAVVYAHRQLAGEPKQTVETKNTVAMATIDPRKLTAEQLRVMDEIEALLAGELHGGAENG